MNGNGNYGNYARLDAKDANIGRLDLTSTFYDTIFLGVGSFHSIYCSSNTTQAITMTMPSSNIASVGAALWSITTASTAALYFSFAMPNRWVEGSTIIPYIHWASSNSTASTAYMTVGMVYNWRDLGTSASSYATQATALQLTPDGSTAYTAHTTNFVAITSTCSVGSIFTGGIYIDTTVANSTYAGSLFIKGMSIVYKVDGLGSTYSNVVDK
jgi:hypothetical protein